MKDSNLNSCEIRELSENEIKDIGGGFWPAIARIIGPTIIGFVSYVIGKQHDDE